MPKLVSEQRNSPKSAKTPTEAGIGSDGVGAGPLAAACIQDRGPSRSVGGREAIKLLMAPFLCVPPTTLVRFHHPFLDDGGLGQHDGAQPEQQSGELLGGRHCQVAGLGWVVHSPWPWRNDATNPRSC